MRASARRRWPRRALGGDKLASFVRTVAKGFVLGVLAIAEPDGSFFLDNKRHRLKVRTFMRAVAKRLRHRATARTPPVFARFKFEFGRIGIEDNGFRHDAAPVTKPTF